MVGEPVELYLTLIAPQDGKSRSVAQETVDDIKHTTLHGRLATVGSDGRAVMTGTYNSVIRSLEKHFEKSLKRSICLLYCNQLASCISSF